MHRELVLVGAGGHAKVVMDIVEQISDYTVIGLLAGGCVVGSRRFGVEVIGNIDEPVAARLRERENPFLIVAIGDNHTRFRVARKIMELIPEARFASVIHPSATVASGVKIGAGTVIAAGAVIGVDSRIGAHVIVNTGASVDHDCTLDDFASVGPGATLGGNVAVRGFSALSIGATVLHGRTIDSAAVVGAGAVVTRDIPPRVVAYGVPARVVRKRAENDKYL